ncbi:MAG: hypothetical protein AAFS10_02915 [Myxococcota bacterium]
MSHVIVVVNGVVDWRPWFPGYDVRQVHLQASRWSVQDGRLWVVDRTGTHRPDAIMWRLGAVTPNPMHRACLDMIRLTGVPCLNSAHTLLRGYDRLGMLVELKSSGLPVIDFDVVAGSGALEAQTPRLPAVLKLDNYHGGQAKALATTEEGWSDLVSLASPYMGYATIEPFITYVRDIRCLLVGDRAWAMERRSSGWKANVETEHHALIEPVSPWLDWTRQAAQLLNADTLGLDFLETPEGAFVLLESNDVPGVRGFPSDVYQAMAQQLIDRLQREAKPTR